MNTDRNPPPQIDAKSHMSHQADLDVYVRMSQNRIVRPVLDFGCLVVESTFSLST